MDNRGKSGVIALLACLIILLLVNLSIAGKEKLLAQGRMVYLQLEPVDPRSLMQGDYMALNFQVARQAMRALASDENEGNQSTDLSSRGGRIVVGLDERSVASFVRLEDELPLAEREVWMRYRVRNGQLKFATNAFFFQEGTGEQYQDARYGLFRVDVQGELLLTRLCDENLQCLGAER
jgi:uncharacterized membrane-anchored protein